MFDMGVGCGWVFVTALTEELSRLRIDEVRRRLGRSTVKESQTSGY